MRAARKKLQASSDVVRLSSCIGRGDHASDQGARETETVLKLPINLLCVHGSVHDECMYECTSMWLVVVWPCGEGGELTKKTQEGEGGGIRLGGIGGRIVDSF